MRKEILNLWWKTTEIKKRLKIKKSLKLIYLYSFKVFLTGLNAATCQIIIPTHQKYNFLGVGAKILPKNVYLVYCLFVCVYVWCNIGFIPTNITHMWEHRQVLSQAAARQDRSHKHGVFPSRMSSR